MHFILILFLLFSISITGCSINKSVPESGQNTTTSTATFANLPPLDEESQKKSDLIYNFLKGELEANEENLEEAQYYFEKASELSEDTHPALHRQLIKIYLEQGELAKVLQENKFLVEKYPDYEVLFLQASIYDALGKYDEAIRFYRQAITFSPDRFIAQIFLASSLYAQGDISSTIVELVKATKLLPDSALGHYYLGGVYRDNNNYLKSERALKKALNLDPDNRKIELSYIYTLILNDKIKEARSLLASAEERWELKSLLVIRLVIDQLLAVDNKDRAIEFLISFIGKEAIDPHELRRHVAILQIEQREFDYAIQNLQILLTTHPEDSKARYFLGTAYAATGLKNRSVVELAKIGPEDQMYIEAKTFASFLLRQLNRLNEAEESIRGALQTLVEPDRSLQLFLIDILRANDKYKEAQVVVEQILSDDPEDEKALYIYATILNEAGRTQNAIKIMEALLVFAPEHPQALNFVAYHLAESGQELDRALSMGLKAMSAYPEDGYFIDTVGWIYYKMGEIEKSLDLLARAVNLTGDDTVILEHYAHALEAAGNFDKALRQFITIANKLNTPVTKKDKEIKRRSQDRISYLLLRNPDLRKIADSAGYAYKLGR